MSAPFLKVASYSVYGDASDPYSYLGSVSVLASPENGLAFFGTTGHKSGYFATVEAAMQFVADHAAETSEVAP